MNSDELFDLTGRRALITGGSGWLGQAMVKTLAESGAEVVIASRDLDKSKSFAAGLCDEGYCVHAEYVDVSQKESVDLLAQSVNERYGNIDILVNNAAGGHGSTVENMDTEQWQSVMDSALAGTFWCCQAFGPDMCQRGYGCIVNISSILALRAYTTQLAEDGGYPPVNYAAAKGGIISLTRALAAEWAPKGIRVNSITPGAFPPPGRHDEGEYLNRLNERIPLGRTAHSDEISGPLLFLCSEASSYVSGHNLVVDGGWSIT